MNCQIFEVRCAQKVTTHFKHFSKHFRFAQTEFVTIYFLLSNCFTSTATATNRTEVLLFRVPKQRRQGAAGTSCTGRDLISI